MDRRDAKSAYLDIVRVCSYSYPLMNDTKKRLITSALPYVNNIPHLGNLIQVLSADVFARYCRLQGYETLYVCGTDEYGTATETRALEEGITPKELCDRYHKMHTDIYRWFNISFDKFGRTSTPEHTQITQGIFLDLYNNGFINERTIQQLYSEKSKMFLADRYVRGTCPNCGYVDARGDQCENCGKLLDPSELIDPRSIIDDSRPVMRETSHLYIDLPAVLPKLQQWMQEASVRGNWARNAVQMTQAWIRDGLKERSITRDLKWGIPVPLEQYHDKVFYVWFDAPIGYISITASLTSEWERWWKNPEEVSLFQFLGKDNIPFHTVVFPCSLLGSGRNWTMLHHMSSTEYLNYESGKFSKSKGVGVFGNDVMDTGIPADVWRFYVYYNRPETSDTVFTWSDFQEKTNGELIGNLSNLVNRTLTFVSRYYNGEVPEAPTDEARQSEIYPGSGSFWQDVRDAEKEITDLLEWAGLRDAFRKIFFLSSYGNRIFQSAEPWKMRTERPESAGAVLHDLIYLVRDLAILIAPYIPETSARIARFLGDTRIGWNLLGNDEPKIGRIAPPEILFKLLENDEIERLRTRFSGTQAERRDAAAKLESTPAPVVEVISEAELPARFAAQVELRVARITSIERHPKADKLYIESIDLGSEQRTIVSGLVPHYSEEELLGHNIIVVANLKPAKLRGVESQGMLLAASDSTAVDVIFADFAEPGTRITVQGNETGIAETLPEIDIDTFFSLPIKAEGGRVAVAKAELRAAGTPLTTRRVADGKVG